MSKHLIIHTDGGARGNPGPAAIGAVIEMDGRVLKKISEYIGETTNNQAEYQAIHAALSFAIAAEAATVDLFSDSELVVRQLRGEYRVKNKELGPWYLKIHALTQRLDRVTWTAVPREQNLAADALVNRALDAHVGNP